jgi:hypothetical protein
MGLRLAQKLCNQEVKEGHRRIRIKYWVCVLKIETQAGQQWLMPVILATQEAEMRRMEV